MASNLERIGCNLCRPTRFEFKAMKTDQSDDAFIINHHRNNKMQDSLLSIDSLDQRRLVFVNLCGLYQSWRRVPSILLYTSLLILPLKKEWIARPSKYIAELQENICDPCGVDMAQIGDFIRLLQWKSSQRLLLFVLNAIQIDEYTRKLQRFVPNPLVAPFWYRVNARLTSLYDHVECAHYKPLSFDEEYWANRGQTKSILAELYFVTMQPSAMQEIIFQSNPDSLRPVIEYDRSCELNVDPIAIDTHSISQINIDGVTPRCNEEIVTASMDWMEASDSNHSVHSDAVV
eukprot:43578_1